MTRRFMTLGAVVALVALTACSLGEKDAMTKHVIAAAGRVFAEGAATGTLSVDVKVVPAKLPVAPGPPRIVSGASYGLNTAIDFKTGRAAVAYGSDTATAAMVFAGSRVYQRTGIKPPAPSAADLANAAGAVPNLQSLASQGSGPVAVQVGTTGVDSNLRTLTAAAAQAAQASQAATTTTVPVTTTTSTTSTTAPGTSGSTSSALHRPVKIQRNWIALDFASLPKRDSNKTAGSYAISPLVIEGLAFGTLTGSIRSRGTETIDGIETVHSTMNVSRDKAERYLPEKAREDLEKIYRANAIGGRVFKAETWVDRNGRLRRIQVRMRQTLSRIDRADLILTLDLTPAAGGVAVAVPDPKTTAVVQNLGQLIHGSSAS